MASYVTVSAPARLHFGLLDLSATGRRVFGGSGAMITWPRTRIQVSHEIRSSDRGTEMPGEGYVDEILRDLGVTSAEVSVRILEQPIAHQGFGSGTSLRLAIATGVSCLRKLDLTKAEIQKISGRGGASGIGLTGFFNGGFITDCGRPRTAVSDLLPSSFVRPATLPKALIQSAMPKSWSIWLVQPEGAQIYGTSEKEFFEANVPIPEFEVNAAIAITYHGIVAGILSEDLACFRDALISLHQVGFKKRELCAQSAAVRQLLRAYWELEELAAGLSSLGPLIYVVSSCNLSATLEDDVKKIAEAHGASITQTTFDSVGAIIAAE